MISIPNYSYAPCRNWKQEWLAEIGYDPSYGARPLKRTIQRQIETPIAKVGLSLAHTLTHTTHTHTHTHTHALSHTYTYTQIHLHVRIRR